ncbi:MAG: hypothetical protein R3208_01065 [Ketobacteraceae bacterium]|nr:hypothetical protein [Ketobacteraceae bacterium]
MSNQQLREKLERATGQLAQARPFNKVRHQSAVFELAGRLMVQENGIEDLYGLAPALDQAGVFYGTDWEQPTILLPGLVRHTLETGDKRLITIEVVSQLRMLAISQGLHHFPGVPPEQARHFLTQILALNLGFLFNATDETLRLRLGKLADVIHSLFQFLLNNIGFEDILGSLIAEIKRILSQRPIQVDQVKSMVTQIAIALSRKEATLGDASLGADRLVSALFGPTSGCQDDPGIEEYERRLAAMDKGALQQEAYSAARAMHDVGLVSDYHAVLLRWLLANGREALIPDALGLSSTGLDALRTFQALSHSLIEHAVFPQTAQVVYGITMLLESGILYAPPIAPGLWRQIDLQLSEASEATLTALFGYALPARVRLLAGVISVLGQPLGLGQGNNPTCQSARAISMWAYNDPDYLLHLIAQVARYDSIMMHFEGRPIMSAELVAGLAPSPPLDTDPVSVLLVPHLDRVYAEMGRLCEERGEDPHRWINPEFHGWWVGREFLLAVDVATGKLKNYDEFITQFYGSYHPLYNGNQPIIHPQPAGLAVTDSGANFVGWHAITLLRVALDQTGVMRVYFYNPNNDSGQNWGNGVIVSTQGYGERYGESSLPFPEMLSRLYIFHDDPVAVADSPVIDPEEVARVKQMAYESWASERVPQTDLVAASNLPGS